MLDTVHTIFSRHYCPVVHSWGSTGSVFYTIGYLPIRNGMIHLWFSWWMSCHTPWLFSRSEGSTPKIIICSMQKVWNWQYIQHNYSVIYITAALKDMGFASVGNLGHSGILKVCGITMYSWDSWKGGGERLCVSYRHLVATGVLVASGLPFWQNPFSPSWICEEKNRGRERGDMFIPMVSTCIQSICIYIRELFDHSTTTSQGRKWTHPIHLHNYIIISTKSICMIQEGLKVFPLL